MAKRPTSKASGLKRRRPSRAEREARMQRGIIIGTIVVAVVVVGLIGFALLNDLVLIPNKAIATVNGDKITTKDFQDRVLIDFYFQTGGVVQQGLDPSLLAQYSLDLLIQGLIVQQQAAERGIEVSDADVQQENELLFGYDSGEPEPTPTITPTRTPTIEPTATSTYVFTPTPSPTPTLEPGVTPTATPTITPTPTATLLPQPTLAPVSEEEYTQQYDQFLQAIADFTGIPVERVQAMWFEQQRIDAGEQFEVLAAELSLDTSNAYKGGDLGWFEKGGMVAEFEEAVFNMEVGTISDPIETQFGWHLIKLYDRRVVKTTPQEQETQRQSEFQDLIDGWRAEGDVVIDPNWANVVPAAPQQSN
ncbi:MAG: peptidylprolyl isomerase [Chloroflexota bacterium]